MSDERKPRSRALINPGNVDMASRHVGRIGRLREAIIKADSRGNTEKAESLNAELNRRLSHIAEIKAELDTI